MPSPLHAVASIDHADAFVFAFTPDGIIEHHILPTDWRATVQHKAGAMGSGHTHDVKTYFTAIAEVLRSSDEIVIVGHGSAKTDFVNFIRAHDPVLASRIMGVETVDHATKPEILAFARKFFERKDIMAYWL
jgi:hypothetical protein